MTQYTEEESYEVNYEESYDAKYIKCKNVMKDIKENIEQSYNPWFMELCNACDLMNLVESGEFELPRSWYTSGKAVKLSNDNVGFIPGPIEYESEEEDLSGWMTVTADGLVPTFKKEKIEEVEEKQQLKEEQERTTNPVNQHNWTMTREERGLPKVQPKQQPKKSKASRRKNRRKGFRANKTAIKYNPNQVTQEVKPKKSGFRVNRTAIAYNPQ